MTKGYSSNDIAELRGVKVETVRSHPQRASSKKTDCHSQNELLLLLQSIS